jgi:hypothetical protein
MRERKASFWRANLRVGIIAMAVQAVLSFSALYASYRFGQESAFVVFIMGVLLFTTNDKMILFTNPPFLLLLHFIYFVKKNGLGGTPRTIIVNIVFALLNFVVIYFFCWIIMMLVFDLTWYCLTGEHFS